MNVNESLLSDVTVLDTEGLKFLDDYWSVRRKYESVFGKQKITEVFAPRPIADRIKEMQDKLDDYYRQQRMKHNEKRMPELANA
jgi:hypothetical protein